MVGARVVEHRLEPPAGELGQLRGRLLEAQEALRRHQHERSRDASSACRRSRWKYCAAVVQFAADVLLRAELEEPLQPRARVLGAVPLVAVRQQQRQARRLLPLRAARDDELVDHDLRAVDEVAELRLPEDEHPGAAAAYSKPSAAYSESGEL